MEDDKGDRFEGRVIDVDAHFHEPPDWWVYGAPHLVGELPPPPPAEWVRMQGESIKLVLPEALRPDHPDEMMPQEYQGHREKFLALQPQRHDPNGDDPWYNGSARLKQMDEWGIDVQWINPTLGQYIYTVAADVGRSDLIPELRSAWGTWCADQVEGMTDRIQPVVQTDLVMRDVDWNVAELTRMRARGARAFRIRQHPEKSLTHTDFEPLWDAAEDLGMSVYVHAGFGDGVQDIIHPSYANNGRGLETYRELGWLMSGLSTQHFLMAMVFDGVLERHPRLNIVVAELKTEWIPQLLNEIDMKATSFALDGLPQDSFYKLPLKPSEYIARQVRVSPLPGYVDIGMEWLTLPELYERIPRDMLVFSSDYPHIEGRDDPVAMMSRHLPADPGIRERFFAGSIADLTGI